MQVARSNEAARYEPDAGWQRISLCDQPNISVEHFVKPPGHASPPHAHPQSQVLVVIEGQMTVVANGRREILGAGDAAFIPGHEEHLVRNDAEWPAIGLDIFVPGREFGFWLRQSAEPLTRGQ